MNKINRFNRFANLGRRFAVLLTLFFLSTHLTVAAKAAPVELRLTDLDGQERSLDEFRGKVVLVSFWASWCAPCLEELPILQKLASEMGDKPLVILGVDVGETRPRVRTIVGRLGIGFPVLLDQDRAVFDRWGVTVLPTTYVLDAEGAIRDVVRGPHNWASAEGRRILESGLGTNTAPNP